MTDDLHMEGLGDEELAEIIDQALASLRLRFDAHGQWANWPELQASIDRTCEAWDEFADALPGFREA